VAVVAAAIPPSTATTPVGSFPYGVAVDPAAGTVYVTNYGDGTVSVIDAATRAVTATIPVGTEPDGVAVDPAAHTAYVANYGAGTVSVITAARPAPVTTLTSSPNPSTFGQNVTFTATVGPAGGGTMTFSSGSQALCRAVPLTQVSGSTYQPPAPPRPCRPAATRSPPPTPATPATPHPPARSPRPSPGP
jgi:YVTN family beta-propeller protein